MTKRHVTKNSAPWNYPFCCGYHLKKVRREMKKEFEKDLAQMLCTKKR